MLEISWRHQPCLKESAPCRPSSRRWEEWACRSEERQFWLAHPLWPESPCQPACWGRASGPLFGHCCFQTVCKINNLYIFELANKKHCLSKKNSLNNLNKHYWRHFTKSAPNIIKVMNKMCPIGGNKSVICLWWPFIQNFNELFQFH